MSEQQDLFSKGLVRVGMRIITVRECCRVWEIPEEILRAGLAADRHFAVIFNEYYDSLGSKPMLEMPSSMVGA